MASLGDNIKAARTKCGMTQEQLATALNTTKAAISRYEAGKREPNIEQLRRIAIAVGTTVSELVGDGYWGSLPEYELRAAFASNPNKEILCGIFDQLTEVGQQKAVEYLEELATKYRA